MSIGRKKRSVQCEDGSCWVETTHTKVIGDKPTGPGRELCYYTWSITLQRSSYVMCVVRRAGGRTGRAPDASRVVRGECAG